MDNKHECWRELVVKPAKTSVGDKWWEVRAGMVESLKVELYLLGCEYKHSNSVSVIYYRAEVIFICVGGKPAELNVVRYQKIREGLL